MTDLGNEVRAEVAAILKRYRDCDLAGIKVSTLKKIDQVLNPEPETFEIIDRSGSGHRALEQARIDRLLFAEGV